MEEENKYTVAYKVFNIERFGEDEPLAKGKYNQYLDEQTDDVCIPQTQFV